MNDFSIKKFSQKPGEWLKGSGADSDIVISSRVRIARNVRGYKFSPALSESDAKNMVAHIIKKLKTVNALKQNMFISLQQLDAVGKHILLERHLISKEHAEGEGIRAVSLSENEMMSIMINEEDHLRIQGLQSGFNLLEAWRIIDCIDSEIEEVLPFSFHPTIGYLTACPTNVGTGLRASCMLHLPSLVMTKQVTKVLQAIAKLNLTVRGLYGEGTQASGNFFQFSNQLTLGKNEELIIEDLEKVVRQVVEHEREARKALSSKRKDKLHDQIWRAVGTLKSAYIMSSQEAMSLLSLLRLGVDLKIVDFETQQLNQLFIVTQPAHLQILGGKLLSPQARDLERARIIRERLQSISL